MGRGRFEGVVITISLNGKPRQVEAAMTVAALLETLGVSPRLVAVAVNGEVVRRDDWPLALVKDGDAVEIVRAVGGG